MESVGDIFVVGTDEACERVAVGLGIGVDSGVLHQLAEAAVKQLVLTKGLGGLRLLPLALFRLGLLALPYLLIEYMVLLGQQAVVAVHAP